VQDADQGLVGRQYLFKQDVKFARQLGPVTLESVRESMLNGLFARSHVPKDTALNDRKFTDLVADRVIGLATVQDVIQFVAEGLRRPDQVLKDEDTFVKLSKDDDTFEDIQPVAASYLAMAIVLSVFPQLDALPDDRFDLAVQHIIDAFGETPFKRIQLNMDPHSKKDFPYCLEHVDAATSGIVDADRNGKISAQEFLLNELCLQYRGTPREVRLRAMLPKRPPLDHPVQRGAEEAVITVLRRRVERRASRTRVEAGRDAVSDGRKTCVKSLVMVPARYWTREPVYLPDAAVLGALGSMASTWIRVLWDEQTRCTTQKTSGFSCLLANQSRMLKDPTPSDETLRRPTGWPPRQHRLPFRRRRWRHLESSA